MRLYCGLCSQLVFLLLHVHVHINCLKFILCVCVCVSHTVILVDFVPHLHLNVVTIAAEVIKHLLLLIQSEDSSVLLPVLRILQSLSDGGGGGLSEPEIELLKKIVKVKQTVIQERFNKRGKYRL